MYVFRGCASPFHSGVNESGRFNDLAAMVSSKLLKATALKRPEKAIERLLIKFTCWFKPIFYLKILSCFTCSMAKDTIYRSGIES